MFVMTSSYRCRNAPPTLQLTGMHEIRSDRVADAFRLVGLENKAKGRQRYSSVGRRLKTTAVDGRGAFDGGMQIFRGCL
jgi:hypothetical protein